MATEQTSRETAYGFPVKSAKELGLEGYFRKNPTVAGMAWGGGENGSDPNEERSVVHNPFNEFMNDPAKREGLYKVEAARHMMASDHVPEFKITPEQQAWREKNFKKGTAYRDNDQAFRDTLISRHLVGDDAPMSNESSAATKAFEQKHFQKNTVSVLSPTPPPSMNTSSNRPATEQLYRRGQDGIMEKAVPEARGKAAALDTWLAQGGRPVRLSGKFRAGPMKGMTYDQAKQAFEEKWATVGDAVKEKYAGRSNTDLAPSERAQVIRPTPEGTANNPNPSRSAADMQKSRFAAENAALERRGIVSAPTNKAAVTPSPKPSVAQESQDRQPLPMPKPGDDPAFDAWKARNAPKDSGFDYDHYAQFKDLNGADPSKDSRGHGTDKYKRPNHPTFSDQSVYSNPKTPGGKWSPDGATYTPSDWMKSDKKRMEDLKGYMQSREPKTKLIDGPTNPVSIGTPAVVGPVAKPAENKPAENKPAAPQSQVPISNNNTVAEPVPAEKPISFNDVPLTGPDGKIHAIGDGSTKDGKVLNSYDQAMKDGKSSAQFYAELAERQKNAGKKTVATPVSSDAQTTSSKPVSESNIPTGDKSTPFSRMIDSSAAGIGNFGKYVVAAVTSPFTPDVEAAKAAKARKDSQSAVAAVAAKAKAKRDAEIAKINGDSPPVAEPGTVTPPVGTKSIAAETPAVVKTPTPGSPSGTPEKNWTPTAVDRTPEKNWTPTAVDRTPDGSRAVSDADAKAGGVATEKPINRLTGLPMGYMPGDVIEGATPDIKARADASVSRMNASFVGPQPTGGTVQTPLPSGLATPAQIAGAKSMMERDGNSPRQPSQMPLVSPTPAKPSVLTPRAQAPESGLSGADVPKPNGAQSPEAKVRAMPMDELENAAGRKFYSGKIKPLGQASGYQNPNQI